VDTTQIKTNARNSAWILPIGALLVALHTHTHAHAADVDVPFIVTAPAVTQAMLDIAKVSKDDYVIDLGAGDGRIVITAAKKFGARGLGVEIDPKLVALARENAKKANVESRAVFREEDLFKTDLSRASVVTMYLLPDVNIALREKVLALKPGTRIVSHDWDMGDWQHDELRVVDNPDKRIGIEKTSRVYRWTVPAKVGGLWCARVPKSLDEPALRVSLDLTQRYQKLEGELRATADGAPKARPMLVKFRATLDASTFAIPHPMMDAKANVSPSGKSLRLNGEPYGLPNGLVFARAREGASCSGAREPVRVAGR
jgi:SAM-dependent methyltransferase